MALSSIRAMPMHSHIFAFFLTFSIFLFLSSFIHSQLQVFPFYFMRRVPAMSLRPFGESSLDLRFGRGGFRCQAMHLIPPVRLFGRPPHYLQITCNFSKAAFGEMRCRCLSRGPANAKGVKKSFLNVVFVTVILSSTIIRFAYGFQELPVDICPQPLLLFSKPRATLRQPFYSRNTPCCFRRLMR